MRYKYLFWIVAFLLLVSVVSAEYDKTSIDDCNRANGLIGTASNGEVWGDIVGTPSISTNRCTFDSSSAETGSLEFSMDSDEDLTFFIQKGSVADKGQITFWSSSDNLEIQFTFHQSNEQMYIFSGDGAGGTTPIIIGTNLVSTTAVNITIVDIDYTAGTYNVYVDGTLFDNSGNGYGLINNDGDLAKLISLGMTGLTYYDYFETRGDASASGSDRFRITAKDYWTEDSLNTFWVYVNNTNYTTTNGTILTDLFQNETETFTVRAGTTDYFNRYFYLVAPTSDYVVELYQAQINFTSEEFITNETVLGSKTNYTIDFIKSDVHYLSAGEHSVLIESSGYYDRTVHINVTALQNETLTLTGLFNAYLNVSLLDVVTTDLIEVNSFLLLQNDFYSYYVHNSNSNGSFYIPTVKGLSLNLSAGATGYAPTTLNFSTVSEVTSINLSLYANNSLWVTAKNFDTGDSLENFSVTVYNDDNVYNFNDVDGTARKNDIVSGVYTVSVAKTGYSSSEYALTVTGGSHQDLQAFLISAGGSTTILTVTNSVTGAEIDNLSVNMYKTLNSSWTLVNSQLTDISGKVQITYTPEVQYKFILSKDGFLTKSFYLKPLFASYTVTVEPETSQTPNINTGDFNVNINPTLFYDEQSNNLTFTIISGSGTLEYYNVTIVAPNVNVSRDFSNAVGGEHDFNFSISGAVLGDTVRVFYGVKESGRSYKTFIRAYPIVNAYNTSTFLDWEEGSSQIGLFGKSIIATIVMLLIVGVVATGSALAGINPFIPSAFALITFMALFSLVGFLPIWGLYISGFSLLLIVLFTVRSN